MVRTFFVFIFFLSLFSISASAKTKIALLIGNQTYGSQVGPLSNPHNDIEVVGSTLRKIGFEVLPYVKDARRRDVLTAVRRFARKLGAAGPNAVGFLYYSGHGAANPDSGENFIIPIDVESATDDGLWDQAVSLRRLVNILRRRAPEAARFVVFDACRNELQTPTKSLTKGFAPVSVQGGTFIAFSTSPNTQASDVGEGTGPYARALAEELVRPGQTHMDVFFNVRKRVATLTGNQQIPWDQSGLLQRVYLNSYKGDTPVKTEEKKTPDIASPPPVTVPGGEAARLWAEIKNTNDEALIRAFMKRFKDNPIYYALGKNKLKTLIAAHDGIWSLAYSGRNCRKNVDEFQFTVRQGSVKGRDRLSGRFEKNGAVRLRFVSKKNRRKGKTFSGSLHGSAGAGVFRGIRGGRCSGTFKLKLVRRLRSDEEISVGSLPDKNLTGGNLSLASALQKELKRVGCYYSVVDGDWGSGSKRAMQNFNRHSGKAFPTQVPTQEAVTALQSIFNRVCPVVAKPKPKAKKKQRSAQSNSGRSAPKTTKNKPKNCRRETKMECVYRVCPAGRGCGLRGSGICHYSRRKIVCK